MVQLPSIFLSKCSSDWTR